MSHIWDVQATLVKKNMHSRSKEHVSKFNSKSEKIRSESAFYMHLMNSHEGKSDEKTDSDYFEIKILNLT